MKIIEVRTQEEFDTALKIPFGDTCIDLIEGEYTITTKGDEAPFLRLGGDVKLNAVAEDSSQPLVVAMDSSKPHIVARGSSKLSISGPVAVKCAPTVSVFIEGKCAKVEGGKQIIEADRDRGGDK
jgi:hypothetical protein